MKLEGSILVEVKKHRDETVQTYNGQRKITSSDMQTKSIKNIVVLK